MKANKDIFKHVNAITGLSGSGKSTASKFLKDFGADIISADEIVRALLDKDGEAYPLVVDAFSDEYLLEDGTLDRKKLHSTIFSDINKRKILEEIIHPLVRVKFTSIVESLIKSKSRCIVYEVPLLFEKKMEELGFNKIIYVTAPAETLLERICSRDNISRNEAENRLGAQLPDEYKRKRSDLIIENNVGLKELQEKVEEVYNEITSS